MALKETLSRGNLPVNCQDVESSADGSKYTRISMHDPRGNNFQLTLIRNIDWSLLLDTCAVMRLGMYHNLQSNPGQLDSSSEAQSKDPCPSFSCSESR